MKRAFLVHFASVAASGAFALDPVQTAAAIPQPSGSYPEVMQTVTPDYPLYFTIQTHHHIPYNPTRVSPDDPHWTFAVTLRPHSFKDTMTFVNRGEVTILVKNIDFAIPKSLRDRKIPIRTHSTASFFIEHISVARYGHTGSFFFAIYDKSAFWPRKKQIPAG